MVDFDARRQFSWQNESDHDLLFLCDQLLGRLQSITTGMDTEKQRISEVENGVFKIYQKYIISKSDQPLELVLDFTTTYKSNWSLIPAISYNGNDWGKGFEPKGFTKDSIPWSFSYTRMSIPGATYSEGERWSTAFFGEINQSDAGFSCSLIPQANQTIHRLIWPEQEGPVTYYRRDKFQRGFIKPLDLKPGDSFEVTVYLVLDKVEQEKVSYRKLLDYAWKTNYHEGEQAFTPEQIWQLGVQYAKETLYVEDGIFQGFSKGLRWNGTNWYLRPTGKYLVGWTGQNLSLANSMLYSYLLNGDQADLEIGLNTLNSWATHATIDNGLIRCLFDPILEGKPVEQGVQDACNLTDAALNFFESYELLIRCRIEKPEYQEIALKICDFAVMHQHASGKFGKSWYNDGTIADPNGTIGCYLVLPLLKAYQVTGNEKYLQAATRGYEFYINSFLQDGYTSAAALDTYCIDKESAIPLLKSSLQLYLIKQDEKYLQNAILVAYYLSTWQWHYTTSYPNGTALNEINYDTFGGTSVSVQHHHLDPYATSYMRDLFQLAQLTGNDIWCQRAQAVWTNGTSGISDGNLSISGVKRPAGSQDEGYYHTYWGTKIGDVSNWLVAWPTAFRLEVLRKTSNWDELRVKL